MRKKLRQTLRFLLFTMLFLSFQNCTKMKMTDLSQSDGKMNDEFFVDPMDFTDPDPTVDMEEPDKDDEVITDVDDVVPDKDDDKDCDKDKEEENIADVDDDDISDDELALLCAEDADEQLAKRLEVNRVAISGPEVYDLRGKTLVVSDYLSRVEKIRGKTVIRGETQDAKADLIHDIRGSVIICGMTVETLSNTRGNVILVNSQVKNLEDHRGNIKLMNSNIESVNNNRGNISLSNSAIRNIADNRGAVKEK